MPPIIPPELDKPRTLVRVFFESLAQAHPVTAGLVGLYRYTHPSQMDKDIEAWRKDVSIRLNNHDVQITALQERLNSRLLVGNLTIELALEVARASPFGMPDPPFTPDEIAPLFPDRAGDQIEQAIYELRDAGLVDILAGGKGRVIEFRPRHPLFWAFDRAAKGYDTIADAAAAAAKMLEHRKFGSIRTLDAALGWERRRSDPLAGRVRGLL